MINCIFTNMLNTAIHKDFKKVKGISRCIFKWIIDYLSIIKIIFDIVSRAVKANIRENMPTARTNKEKIEYRRIKFFDAIIKALLSAIAISVEKLNSAVLFCACKISEGGDYYD